ncbi:MAG: amidohydrolase family protein [Asticcacaulis sp.]|uniref:amidohydrolase family protein n=1 Tax=Asticcacaulis sp. TaxID=1872648 RepID=UPI0039E6123C
MAIRRFVDAHMHLWQLGQLRYPWLSPPFADDGPNGSVETIASDYTLPDYFRDSAGFRVEKIVHIDAGAHPDDALAEPKWLQSLADQDAQPAAIVAFAALNEPDVERLLAAHAEQPNVRGIRHILNWHADRKRTYTPRNLLDDESFDRGYGLLAKYNLSFDLQIYPGQMQQAAALAARHPDVPVILNHMGMPVDVDLTEWQEGLKALAALPHVAVKISGMGFVDRQWTTASMRPLILQVIETFGPARCAFASDFPTDKLFNSYGKALDAYDEITKDFSADERDALFAGSAERLYRL